MKKENLQSVYEQHHEKKGRYGYLFCHGERIPYLKRWIGKKQEILDLGCRDGTLTKHYSEGNYVTGVDIDKSALKKAREDLGIQTLWLDLNNEWPFEPESKDVIIACEVLEHVFNLEPLLDHIFQTLKPGGIFLGSVPNSYRLRNRCRFLLGKPYETDPTHVRSFSYANVETMLSEYFTEVEIALVRGQLAWKIPISENWPLALKRYLAKDLLWKAKKPL